MVDKICNTQTEQELHQSAVFFDEKIIPSKADKMYEY